MGENLEFGLIVTASILVASFVGMILIAVIQVEIELWKKRRKDKSK